MRAEHKGVAAALLSSCLGGTAVVVTRHTVGQLDPLTLALLRFGIGVACLGALFLASRLRPLRGPDLRAALLLGGLFFAAFPTLFNLSLAWTTAARGALALSTLPLLTLLLAAAVGAERLTRTKVGGVGLAMAGVAFALSGDLAGAPPGAWRGDLVMIATAACGAAYNVLSRPLLRRHPPLAFITQAMLAGTVLLACAVALGGEPARLGGLTPAGWLAVAYLGVAGGAAAFWLWTVGLEHTTPTRVAVTVAVNPMVAMGLGALLLGEPVSAHLVLGLVAVAAGILLTTRGGGEPVRRVSPAAGSRPRAAR